MAQIPFTGNGPGTKGQPTVKLPFVKGGPGGNAPTVKLPFVKC